MLKNSFSNVASQTNPHLRTENPEESWVNLCKCLITYIQIFVIVLISFFLRTYELLGTVSLHELD